MPGRRSRQPQTVPTPTVVLPNPVLPTKTATIRRLAGWLLRRGRKAEQGWPQGVVVADTPDLHPIVFIYREPAQLHFTESGLLYVEAKPLEADEGPRLIGRDVDDSYREGP